MFGFDCSNSLLDYDMFGSPEDSSWFMWKIYLFTLAKRTLAARSLQNPTHVRTAFVAGRAVRLATDSKTATVNGSSIRPCFFALRAGSHLPVG